MKISIVTLFPEMIEQTLQTSILGRAKNKGLVEYEVIRLREFGEGIHQIVDGAPYGGGAGMVLRADILAKAWAAANNSSSKPYTLLMSASGRKFNQAKAQTLSNHSHLILICGHYEGVDQRFIDKFVDEEISIGDYVLTGGEIPALAVIDAVVRLIPGVLAKEESYLNDSFSENLGGLLEHPQYTRPAVFEGMKVPEVLQSGHHQKIEEWRQKQSWEKTVNNRPELTEKTDKKN